MIMRYAALAGWACTAILAVMYSFQRTDLTDTKRQLDTARAYIETTKDVRDATDNLPTDPDDVLERLLRFAE